MKLLNKDQSHCSAEYDFRNRITLTLDKSTRTQYFFHAWQCMCLCNWLSKVFAVHIGDCIHTANSEHESSHQTIDVLWNTFEINILLIQVQWRVNKIDCFPFRRKNCFNISISMDFYWQDKLVLWWVIHNQWLHNLAQDKLNKNICLI